MSFEEAQFDTFVDKTGLSSTGCTRPRPGFAFYNTSKAAVSVSLGW